MNGTARLSHPVAIVGLSSPSVSATAAEGMSVPHWSVGQSQHLVAVTIATLPFSRVRGPMIHTRFSDALQADESGRTVFGIVVPFDSIATVDDGKGPYRETFLRGAFARTIAQRGDKVRLHLMHDTARSLPIGKAVELEERPEGLFGAFKVARTQSGDDALTAIREGLAESFSIGFTPIREETLAGVVQRREVALREVSIVHTPAYAGAAIAGIRSQTLLSAVDFRRRLQLLTQGITPHE